MLPATTNGHVAGDKEEVFDRNVDYGSSMRIVGDEFRGKGRITGHEEVVKCLHYAIGGTMICGDVVRWNDRVMVGI